MKLNQSLGLGLSFNSPMNAARAQFLNGEQGFLWDLRNRATVFQDTIGNTPVTQYTDPVGMVKDQSGRNNHAIQSTAGSRPLYQLDGVPVLDFDGTDDFLSVAPFATGTNQAQIYMRLRKDSDAATQAVLESSASSSANNGALAVFAPLTAASPTYVARSRGMVTADAVSPASYAAPSTVVLTALLDISGDSVTLRINGVAGTPTTTDQGAATYGTHTHYIGRRAGTSLPFNGAISALMVRYGPTPTAAQITAIEALMA